MPKSSSKRAKDEYEVEAILGHREAKSGFGLEYKVRWAGYTPDDDTWEPESNFNHNLVLDEYKFAVGLSNASEVKMSKHEKSPRKASDAAVGSKQKTKKHKDGSLNGADKASSSSGGQTKAPSTGSAQEQQQQPPPQQINFNDGTLWCPRYAPGGGIEWIDARKHRYTAAEREEMEQEEARASEQALEAAAGTGSSSSSSSTSSSSSMTAQEQEAGAQS